MLSLPKIPFDNWKPVAIRLGVGAVFGVIGALCHHPWIAAWSAFVLAFGFGVDSYTTGENRNAVIVDIGLVLVGCGLGILLKHLL